MSDLIIRGGLIVDGTGRDAFLGDVRIADDRISAVGTSISSEPAQQIDARGLVVAPGFIDLHSHSDFTLLVNRQATSALLQGVTTEVVGNCGLSFAPAYRKSEIAHSLPTYLRDVLITWSSFGEYLGVLADGGIGINVAHLVGFNALRLSSSGYAARPASRPERRKMSNWLAEAIAAGAWGFSAGLEYVPGSSATREEITTLARVAAEADALVAIHGRGHGETYLDAVQEAIRIGSDAGARLQISHMTPHRYAAPAFAAKTAADQVSRFRLAGLDVAFDVHPYLWGLSFLTAALPAWALDGGPDELAIRLSDQATRSLLRQNSNPLPNQLKSGMWHTLIPRNLQVLHEYNGLTMAAIARDMGKDPWDALFDILVAERVRATSLLWIFEIIDEEDLHLLMRQPDCIVESDGMALDINGPLAEDAPHPRCFGWTARFLGYHVRERGVLNLTEAIRRITSLPADRLRIVDRGRLEPGAYADVVVFDPVQLADLATYDHPARAPRGIRAVVVNGSPIVDEGNVRPLLAGRILRR